MTTIELSPEAIEILGAYRCCDCNHWTTKATPEGKRQCFECWHKQELAEQAAELYAACPVKVGDLVTRGDKHGQCVGHSVAASRGAWTALCLVRWNGKKALCRYRADDLKVEAT